MNVGVMGQSRAPGVQHGGDGDTGSQVFGIGGNGQQGLGGGLEQYGVDDGLVVIGDVIDLRRQGEHDMVIFDGQQIGLTRFQPIQGRRSLTLGAMAVAARVVGDADMAAVAAGLNMAAERRRATTLDGRHHLQLAEADMAGTGHTPGRSVGAQDIRDLQMFPRHDAIGSGGRQLQVFERAFDRVQGGVGDMGVTRRGIELLVAQQHLDQADIHILFQ